MPRELVVNLHATLRAVREALQFHSRDVRHSASEAQVPSIGSRLKCASPQPCFHDDLSLGTPRRHESQ